MEPLGSRESDDIVIQMVQAFFIFLNIKEYMKNWLYVIFSFKEYWNLTFFSLPQYFNLIQLGKESAIKNY